MVARAKPGETLDLGVWRDNKKITIPVKIESQPEDFYANRSWQRNGGPGQEEEGTSQQTRIESVGMTVATVTPELATKHGLDYDEVKGQVMVTEVDPMGEAGALRLTPGDLILSVQGKKLTSPAALKQALQPRGPAAGSASAGQKRLRHPHAAAAGLAVRHDRAAQPKFDKIPRPASTCRARYFIEL